MAVRPIVSLLIITLVACSESPTAGVISDRTAIDLDASFGDLTSNVGASAITVTLAGDADDDGAIKALVDAMVLRTYPEGDAVAAIPALATPVMGARSIVIAPAAALADRWYAVGFTSVDEDVFRPPEAWVGTKDGGYFARFRPGSAPVVAHFQVCPKGADSETVIDISEAVTAPADGVAVTIGGAACPLTQTNGSQILAVCSNAAADPTVSVVFGKGVVAGAAALEVLDQMTTPPTFVDATGASYSLAEGPIVSGCQDYPLAF